MILDSTIFTEVINAIGVETGMSVIGMFLEQSVILMTGASDQSQSLTDRAAALHALKGMAQQLGLSELSESCKCAEQAILDNTSPTQLDVLIQSVQDTLTAGLAALEYERDLLLV